MKLAISRKFSNEFPPSEVSKMLSEDIYKAKFKQLKIGIGLSNMCMKFGQDCDDFVLDLSTSIISFDVHKIPRFVANSRMLQLRKKIA